MFKASELVEFAKSMIGMPYWYGCVVYPCTESRLQGKAKQYPDHYGSSRMAKYRQAIEAGHVCMDCVGLLKGFFWTNGGQGVVDYIKTGKEYANKYGSNSCPDKSANGMLEWCKNKGCKWGTIDTLPEIPGIPVYSPGHVGVYIGNGEVVEARGFAYGVVKTKLKGRPWKHWAMLPDFLIQYDNVANEPAVESKPEVEPKPTVVTPVEYKLGERLLRKTTPIMTGSDVEELQNNLMKLGFTCGNHKADGKFGNDTKIAVRNFQRKYGLVVDGEYGPASHKAMLEALKVSVKNVVSITGNSVNVRKGPGTSYGVLKVARKGDKFERVDMADWACVKYDGVVCWVFDDYVIDGVCTASSLNIRKGPSTDYGTVDAVKKGYKFECVNTNGWVPVKIDGAIYWVSAKYAE